MRSFFAVAVALSVSAVSPAFAGSSSAAPDQVRADDDHEEKPKFPMTGPAFKQMIDERTAKARQRMEACAVTLPAAQAQAMRAEFDAGVVKIDAEVAAVTADGTVTKDEAKKVRDVAKSVHHDPPKGCKS